MGTMAKWLKYPARRSEGPRFDSQDYRILKINLKITC